MASLFLSYAREDLALAERLAEDLRTCGHEVWWDRRLAAGSAFGDEIEKAIGQSDHVLVLWTEHSVRSSWVRDEAELARDCGKLVPLGLGSTVPPLGFRQFHVCAIDDWAGGGGTLPDALIADLGGAKAGEPERHEQQIRFCRTDDGVSLAWSETGEGRPVLKLSNWLNHLEFEWDHPMWKHWIDALSDRRRLIRYDQRGNGMSDRNVGEPTVDRMVEDARSVADAAGLDRMDLFAISQGSLFAVAFAVRYPERVRKLCIVNGFATGWKLLPSPAKVAEWEAMLTLVRTGWGKDNPAFRQMFTAQFFPDITPQQAAAWNQLQRVSASARSAEQTLRMLGDADVTDLLPQVRVPTLIIHSRGDQVIPFEAGRLLAGAIPGAQFHAVESDNHLTLGDEPAWPRVRKAIVDFLDSD